MVRLHLHLIKDCIAFIHMPFELQIAPVRFQSTKDVILFTMKWQCAHVCLEGIVVFSRKSEELVAHVKHVLTLLHDTEDILTIVMSKFFTNTINFFGHVI